jgi:hypothetical protein
MRNILAQIVTGCALVSFAVALIGCGGGGAGGNGTLSLHLADAPDPTTTAVNITIDKVEAHVDGTWQLITAPTPAFEGNLLDYVTTTTPLGTTSLPSGHYTQVRLFISSASITDETGTYDLVVPSGAQTGLKVLVNYDINAGDVTNVLLDFDVAKSINKLGNGTYHLQPVVRGSVDVLSGTVTGKVEDANGPVMGAVVSLTPDGQAPSDTDPSVLTLEDGTFKVWGVMPGTYDISVNYEPSGGTAEVGSLADQIVAAAANTDAGTITIAAAP